LATKVPSEQLSAPPRSGVTGNKSRHVAQLSNVPLLGRTAFASRLQQVASQTARSGSNYPNLIAFLQFWRWIGPYLRDLIHTTAPYETYPAGKTGIFDITFPPEEGPMRIAVAADWGTGTLEAETVAKNMKSCEPHYTLHLGDVYYMGESEEIEENCLGKPRNNFTGVKWPLGSRGSFGLMGNHEMYSGGQGYYQSFVNALGLLKPDRSVKEAQGASFFCLDTGRWLVLGLDTGYHSGGMPLFTAIPWLNTIPSLNVDAHFDEKMMSWLQETMKAVGGGAVKKPVLILTHHQPISSFEHAFAKPAKQLAQSGLFDGQEVVWLFGHEHRMTLYKKQVVGDSLTAYPRCIGHGGMPTEVTTVNRPKPEILYYDPREHPIDNQNPDTMVGYNGHVVAIFTDAALTIEYHDILDNSLLLTETFRPGASGVLQYVNSKPPGSPLR
jgi:hypothetical protein